MQTLRTRRERTQGAASALKAHNHNYTGDEYLWSVRSGGVARATPWGRLVLLIRSLRYWTRGESNLNVLPETRGGERWQKLNTEGPKRWLCCAQWREFATLSGTTQAWMNVGLCLPTKVCKGKLWGLFFLSHLSFRYRRSDVQTTCANLKEMHHG